MSVTNFNATVWSGVILQNLRKAHVAAGAANRNYEGDITQFGDRVKINNIQAITSKEYTTNSDIDGPDELTGEEQFLDINQRRYINFQIDDVDQAQQRPKIMSEAMAEASHALSDDADGYILSLHTDVDSSNYIGETDNPITLTTSNVYDRFTEAGQLLDENNVPRGNRWVIVPPWVHSLLVRSDEFVKAGTELANQTILNGMVGQIGGFSVLMSNNVDSTYGEADVMFGYPGAITFAEQILNMEAYRPEKRFADAVKGLYVYGAKVTRSKGLVVGFFDKET